MVGDSATNIRDNIYSPFEIINNFGLSYNKDGEPCMDKTEKSKTKEYQFGNNIVSVERHFGNNIHINDILKKYIYEQNKNFGLHNSVEKCYNSKSNITVVDFSEGRNK